MPALDLFLHVSDLPTGDLSDHSFNLGTRRDAQCCTWKDARRQYYCPCLVCMQVVKYEDTVAHSILDYPGQRYSIVLSS